MPFYSYKIAAGYNNAAGLVNIESIVPSSDRAFFPPVAIGGYSPGLKRYRGDGTVYRTGYPLADWQFAVITRAQYAYLRTTYCNGEFSGKVTIATRTGVTSYANYNAIMDLPVPNELEDQNPPVWTGFTISFRRLVAL